LIKVRRIKPEETYPIRQEVLRKNIDLPYKFEGDIESQAMHYGCFKNEKLVSIATVIKRKNGYFKGKQYQLRGMATLSEYQGLGLGKKLLIKLEEEVAKQSAEVLWCNARVKAVKFYEKLGFKKVGERFEIPQIGGHFIMYKKLK